MTYCKWDSHRLQSYKNDNGFRLISSNHIEHVQISETFQNNYMYIKSDCIPETRQTSDPYKTCVLARQSGQIVSGGSTCVA